MTEADLRTVHADAAAAAAEAAGAAAVCVRQLSSLDELDAARRLCAEIWRTDPEKPLVTTELLRALTKAGNYVAGAFDSGDGRLIGTCVGFFEAPADRAVHSHVAGVAPAARARGVGRALKVDQRAWALRHGVTTISWTFDPLASRNAYFNIGKLAALPVEYLPDFYGSMRDGINEADQSDRLLVRWRLADAAVRAACLGRTSPADAAAVRERGGLHALAATADGRPGIGPGMGLGTGPGPGSGLGSGSADAPALLVAVPRDIVALRAADPGLAREWRHAVREVLGGLLAAGGRITGFDPAGWYVVAAGTAAAR